MTTWPQNYDPLHAWPLSTLVSALPVLTLFFVLLVRRKRVWVAALRDAAAVVLAWWSSACRRRWWRPVHSGSCSAFSASPGSSSRRSSSTTWPWRPAVPGDEGVDRVAFLGPAVAAVLIAFCFGAFLEGTGGGGAPVAIAGSFLIGLGFEPFQAATLCLLANTAPVAWGGVGNPIRVLAGVTGLPEPALIAMTGRILPPLSAILPFWLVRSMVGWRQTLDVWPALLVSGLSFAVAVLLVELSGTGPGRRRLRPRLAAGDGRVPEGVAAADRRCQPGRSDPER